MHHASSCCGRHNWSLRGCFVISLHAPCTHEVDHCCSGTVSSSMWMNFYFCLSFLLMVSCILHSLWKTYLLDHRPCHADLHSRSISLFWLLSHPIDQENNRHDLHHILHHIQMSLFFLFSPWSNGLGSTEIFLYRPLYGYKGLKVHLISAQKSGEKRPAVMQTRFLMIFFSKWTQRQWKVLKNWLKW